MKHEIYAHRLWHTDNALGYFQEIQSSEFSINNELQKMKAHFCKKKVVAELNKMKAYCKSAQSTSAALFYAYLLPSWKQFEYTMQIFGICDSNAHWN